MSRQKLMNKEMLMLMTQKQLKILMKNSLRKNKVTSPKATLSNSKSCGLSTFLECDKVIEAEIH